MARYRIVCIGRDHQQFSHSHIVGVGTGDDASKADRSWPVSQVWSAIAIGDRFYTVSPASGKEAVVEPYDCSCGVKTIRSDSAARIDNNLENLKLCHRS
jgi:hypothetical protein